MESKTKSQSSRIQISGCSTVLLIVFGFLIFLYFKCEKPIEVDENNKTVIGPTIISQIKGNGDLCLREIHAEELGIIKGITGKLIKRYHGTIRLGVKLENISDNCIKYDSAKNKLTCYLPKITMLDSDFIDESKTETLCDDAITRFSNNDLNQCFEQARQKMIDNNFTPENIKIAEDQGIKEIKKIIDNNNFKGEIEVKFGEYNAEKR